MADAAAVLLDRRSLFLERVAAMLILRGRFDDNDVRTVTTLAAQGFSKRRPDDGSDVARSVGTFCVGRHSAG
jgi:hypothetical protein